MKKIPLTLISAGLLATALPAFAQTTEVLHDWQFNEPEGTGVFLDVQDAGTQAGSDSSDWFGTTTDGAGSWHVTNTTENNYLRYKIHSSGKAVVADKMILEWAYTSWNWSLTAQKSPNFGLGLYTATGNGAVTILRNGTSMRTRDTITTDVVNFGTNTWDSTAIPTEAYPVDQASGTPLPDAPPLTAGAKMKMRYVVDFTGESPTYTIDYAVNSSDWYTLYTGAWTEGDITDIRIQGANPDELCSIKVDYITLTGENVVLPAGSIWDGVGTDYGNGIKWTGLGLINDSNWPWVWHYNSGSWVYIEESSTLTNIYGYAGTNEGAAWFWSSDEIGGYYYDLSNPDSGTMGWSRTW